MIYFGNLEHWILFVTPGTFLHKEINEKNIVLHAPMKAFFRIDDAWKFWWSKHLIFICSKQLHRCNIMLLLMYCFTLKIIWNSWLSDVCKNLRVSVVIFIFTNCNACFNSGCSTYKTTTFQLGLLYSIGWSTISGLWHVCRVILKTNLNWPLANQEKGMRSYGCHLHLILFCHWKHIRISLW